MLIHIKRKLAIFLVVAVAFAAYSSITVTPVQAFSGGTGTSGDPYQITTPAELASLSSYLGSGNSTKYFKLMNDIDLNVSPYNTGTGWTPIGSSSASVNFYGKFDGNYKTISNLYINSSGGNYLGLFGYINSAGLVQNVKLSNANVTGSYGIGSLAGQNNGTITKAGVTGGSVTGIQRVGGLVGSNQGTMTYDYSNNSVYFNPTSSPTCCAGGLTGEAYGSSASINNSYSRSSITMTYNIYNQGSVGGLYGNDYTSSTKTKLYSTGAITMVSGSFPSNTGGLAGSNYTSTTSSYWDTQTSGWATSQGGAGVVGKTTAQMKDQATYSGWDFSTVWAIDGTGTINNGYPYLQWQNGPDTTAPTISSVSSDKANGSYTAGEVIDIDVTFSEAVTSTGNVTVTLETGTTDRTCTFSVTASATGTCNYTVQSGDESADLTVSSIAGTIADAASNAMSNFVPTTNLAANKALVIDTVTPSVPGTPSVTTAANDNTPSWSWTASTDVLSGVNSYLLQWSSDSNFASYSSTSTGSNAYTIPVSLSDGTWYFRAAGRDTANNASSYSTAGSVTIDTVAPTVSTLTPVNNLTSVSRNAQLSIKFNSPITVGAGNITIYELGSNSVFETISVNSLQVTGGGTDTITIVPIATFAYDTTYYVKIDNTAFADTATNSYVGISDNSSWRFTVQSAPPSTAPNSSTGESSPATKTNSSFSSKPTATTSTNSQNQGAESTTILNDFIEFTDGGGKQLELQSSQVVYFKVKEQQHSAEILEVGDDYVVVTVASTPTTLTLRVGETKSHDASGDGIADIEITLVGITKGVANLRFKQLDQAFSNDILNDLATNLRVANKNSIIWYFLILFMVIGFLTVALSNKSKLKKKTTKSRN